MGSLKFQLIIFGGIADDPEPKVAADKVADVLKGMTLDVLDICRNLSADEAEVKGCRVYVEGPPQKGRSLAFPMTAEEEWGIQAYASGIVELRESEDLGAVTLPKGFDESILRRIRGYCQEISEDHNGFTVEIPAVNGTPAVRATFDARLKTAIGLKIAVLEHDKSATLTRGPDLRTHGYSIQGVLHTLSNPDYMSPEGKISVEIDPRDGRRWLCHLDKKTAPANLKDLYLTEVLVTGTATMRARKPEIDATSLTPLPGFADPVKALDDLIALCGEVGKEPVQAFMDRVRERD